MFGPCFETFNSLLARYCEREYAKVLANATGDEIKRMGHVREVTLKYYAKATLKNN